MTHQPNDMKPYLVFLSLLIVVVGFLFWKGPANLSGSEPGSPITGEPLKGNSALASERGYIRFNVKGTESSLPQPRIVQIATRFGVSESALLNANNARGQNEIPLKADKQIRIPLKPK